jgi:uncharacterized RDD family membrane protein YckC
MQKNKIKPGGELNSVPGFFRRLAVMVYDLLLLVGLLFFATALLLPFNAGVAFDSTHIFYRLYLLVVSFVFYGWFWTHGGQTLGLRAWKLRVSGFDNKPLDWLQSLFRFTGAIISLSFFGLGFLWVLVDRNRYSWHDYLSKTAVYFDNKYGND